MGSGLVVASGFYATVHAQQKHKHMWGKTAGLAAAQPQQRRERPAAPQGVVAPAAAASPQAGHASAPSPAAPASLNSRWGAQELSAQLDQICRELDAAVEVLPD
eukprot:TRINITY_DN11192_c0_g1_i3.p1 TRINITY_DN11192_c0_g1~~TRINITY_DN11192_c0_g1_i3.p1  ORF type:complete len:104 (-),score=20.46 TRINITY_DN11192_c0_g1_i3:103-414(-)